MERARVEIVRRHRHREVVRMVGEEGEEVEGTFL